MVRSPNDTTRPDVLGGCTFQELDTFDPSDHHRLHVQDVAGAWWDWWPRVSFAEVRAQSDTDLARYARELRGAVLLPLDGDFVGGMRVILAFCEAELLERARKHRGRRRYAGRSDAWERADLLAEVEAVTGPLQRRGREWWARCPFHEDRTPSFHVDPERRVWRCFGCGAGGGVLAWRQRIEERSA
jgi:hypothetical protein